MQNEPEAVVEEEVVVVPLKEACEMCKGLGRLNPKTLGFIHVDSTRTVTGRFGPGWYFGAPIAFTIPKDMTVWGDDGNQVLKKGTTVGIVFIYEDGRVSTALLPENNQQLTGCFRLPLFDDATEAPIVQPF